MRAIQLTAFGTDNLQLVDLPEPPQPGPGEALVQLRAASLNYRDLLMIDGHYDPRVPLPLVPLPRPLSLQLLSMIVMYKHASQQGAPHRRLSRKWP